MIVTAAIVGMTACKVPRGRAEIAALSVAQEKERGAAQWAARLSCETQAPSTLAGSLDASDALPICDSEWVALSSPEVLFCSPKEAPFAEVPGRAAACDEELPAAQPGTPRGHLSPAPWKFGPW